MFNVGTLPGNVQNLSYGPAPSLDDDGVNILAAAAGSLLLFALDPKGSGNELTGIYL